VASAPKAVDVLLNECYLISMNFRRSMFGILTLFIIFAVSAQASATHTAVVDVKLIMIDEKNKEHELESKSGKFFMDWNTKKCEIQLKKSKFVYCNLDISEDIVNSKGELVMKQLPQAIFEGGVMDALIRVLGAESNSTKKIISKVVEDTTSSRAKGFKLPFYSCGDCEKNGKDLMLWNAYHGTVSRELSIEHSVLGRKKLVLRMKIQEMEAVKGVFNIIGNSNASEYGR
jgi:hypothetical protein